MCGMKIISVEDLISGHTVDEFAWNSVNSQNSSQQFLTKNKLEWYDLHIDEMNIMLSL